MSNIDVNKLIGLSDLQVKEQLKKFGYNELPSSKRRNIFFIIFDVIKEPMFILLVACGLLYFLLGDVQEAIMLTGFVFIVMSITLYQERKTERALEALRDLSSPRALVIRDGVEKRIPGREVVSGDILIVKEGDRVPADAELISSANLSIDESLLTGESVPVRKDEQCNNTDEENCSCIYASTLVVQGHGVAKVISTGMNTKIGGIGKIIKTVSEEETRLQKETKKIVSYVVLIGMIVCALVVIAYGITRSDWINGLLAGITLAMALLPEEFPVVLTIFLALGAYRISKKNVLTRKVPAIEMLGAATVLCVDKTGTLTQNKMTVKKIFADDKHIDFDDYLSNEIPEHFHELLEYGILAGQQNPFDPMEKAIKELGDKYLVGTEHIHVNWNLEYEYALSKKLLALSHAWRCNDGRDYCIAAKGAPEAIFDLCHMSELDIKNLEKEINNMAKAGLRVLGVAKSEFKESNLPLTQHDFDFQFIGLIGFSDPVRPSVKGAVNECYNAGIRIIMITGDYPVTAQNIAKQIGLNNPDEYITGKELESISDDDLKNKIKTINVFARVMPEQKLRIVDALKSNGEIVSMTGDGVNDAPALKSAHIGVAMGERGSDVARECSDLVLLKDDFSSIVDSVRLGRRIFDNIRKAMAYILAVHVPIAGISLFPILLNLPLIFLPVHIVFLELIIDPACSTVFEAEPEEKNIMNRKPRDPKEPLFSRKMIVLSLFQGLSVLGIILAVIFVAKSLNKSVDEIRALSFTTLVIANIGLILTNRSWIFSFLNCFDKKNTALWIVVSSTIFFLVLTITVPFLRNLFHFEILHFIDIVICFTAGIAGVVWFEIFKILNFKKNKLLL
jgi:P-type Ca2+ transporter type 2C